MNTTIRKQLVCRKPITPTICDAREQLILLTGMCMMTDQYLPASKNCVCDNELNRINDTSPECNSVKNTEQTPHCSRC